MIDVGIIKDSITTGGNRITTFVLKYPRFIHSEFMTHRVFSRNASSSRAIPVKKQLLMIWNDMAKPIRMGLNQPGMQAYEDATGFKYRLGRLIWNLAALHAIGFAYLLNKLGFHKQIVNRITEPFAHITVICTATDFDNFFELRYHEAAQPEIYELAKQMYGALLHSDPQLLKKGEWHLPFVDDTKATEENIARSVACCARVSYMNHDKTNPTHEQNKSLYDRLLGAQPIHASPAEHQAQAANKNTRSGNFVGWVQYRKTLKSENIEHFQLNIDNSDK